MGSMEVICKVCSSVFLSYKKTQQYCSKKCAGKEKKDKVKIKCHRKECDNVFLIKWWEKKKYCCRKCFDICQRIQKENTRVCAQCQTEKPLDQFAKKNKSSEVVECYCKQCRRNKRVKYAKTPHARWLQSKRRAEERGLIWTINFEDYEKLLMKNCAYCEGKINIYGVGLDRKNNTIGYILENVVPCCGICNKLKSDYLNYEEMMELKPFLIKFRKSRTNFQ